MSILRRQARQQLRMRKAMETPLLGEEQSCLAEIAWMLITEYGCPALTYTDVEGVYRRILGGERVDASKPGGWEPCEVLAAESIASAQRNGLLRSRL